MRFGGFCLDVGDLLGGMIHGWFVVGGDMAKAHVLTGVTCFGHLKKIVVAKMHESHILVLSRSDVEVC